jgi:hypothetical protein
VKKLNLLWILILVLCLGSTGFAQKGNRGRGQGREERIENRGVEGREERRADVGRGQGREERMENRGIEAREERVANRHNRGLGREERTERRGVEGLEERSVRSRGNFTLRHRHTHFDNGVRRQRRVRRGWRH